jgi:hypothetical protein
MGIFQKIFRRTKRQEGHVDPADNPNMIQVYDGYGRPMYVTKSDWKSKVLIPNLQKARNDSDELYNLLISAINDGFATEILPHAKRLQQIDPNAERGAVVLAIVNMEIGKPIDAEQVLSDFVAVHGETGIVATNLAKTYSLQGKSEQAEEILWHALELDPNQDNGLSWYAATQRDRGGEVAELAAYQRVSQLPGSWRAGLWVAKSMLEDGDLESAESVYRQSLERAGRLVPADVLMQMSGDLGNLGYLKEIIAWVLPHFDPSFHGLSVGNNLIKAYFDLGYYKEARQLTDTLYALQRPDWQETLGYWDTELAKAGLEKQNNNEIGQPEFAMFCVQGPIWTHKQPLLADLIPSKPGNAVKIAFFGNTVLYASTPNANQSQLADTAGRLSRSIPLLLAETAQLHTESICQTFVGYVQRRGFAVFGERADTQSLYDMTGKDVDYIAGITIDTREEIWKAELVMVSRTDGNQVAAISEAIESANPGPGVANLTNALLGLLAGGTIANRASLPDWYMLPSETELSDYLLRLEQQLVIIAEGAEGLQSGGISGEREMLHGILNLCLSHPANALLRMVLAGTFDGMRQVRPKVADEYEDRMKRLQDEYPLEGKLGKRINQIIYGQ